MIIFENWKNAVLGAHLDVDHQYGGQCVDVDMSWVNVLYPGVGWATILGYGNAKDLFRTANPHYLEKVQNNHQDVNQMPPEGAIVVFDGTKKNPAGHTGVTDHASAQGVVLIEQNGLLPYARVQREMHEWANSAPCIGWLVPRDLNTNPGPTPPVHPVTSKGAPVVNNSVIGHVLFLKPYVQSWRVYPPNKSPVPGHERGVLTPDKYGGLNYKILGLGKWPQTVIIQTQMLGKVMIYVDSDAAIH